MAVITRIQGKANFIVSPFTPKSFRLMVVLADFIKPSPKQNLCSLLQFNHRYALMPESVVQIRSGYGH
jgi:hypothetical protein